MVFTLVISAATGEKLANKHRVRKLKIMFVLRDGKLDIKSACEPTEAVMRIYNDMNPKTGDQNE